MTIEQYLRLELTNKWVSLVKQNECETCGKKDNLEVHHVKQFIVLLDETLKLLELENKGDIENYSDQELEKIKLIMLGKHLDNEYLTLCTKCHDEIHKLNGIIKLKERTIDYNKKNIKEYLNKLIDKENIITYCNKIVNIKLFKEEQDNLKDFLYNDLLYPIKKNHNSIGYNIINKFLEENNVNFNIKAAREYKKEHRHERYWVIFKLENNQLEEIINE